MPTTSPNNWLVSILASAKRHQVLLGTLLGISVIAAGTNAFLRADLTGGNGEVQQQAANGYSPDSPLSCTSEGSIFQDISSPGQVIELFRTRMSEVITEREDLLKNKSIATLWPCFTAENQMQEPFMPALEMLASELPGWRYPVSNFFGMTLWVPKPVSFDSFESVVRELLREYECKLTEFQEFSLATVMRDKDIDAPTDNYWALDFGHLTFRTGRHFDRMAYERQRARTAVERSISSLRSYAIHAPFTVQMSCLHRATLDLKTELSLAADAMSCMPKIWDAVTSVHDRKYPYGSQ